MSTTLSGGVGGGLSNGGYNQRPGTTVLPTSNGGVIMVVLNRNASGATLGDGTNVAKFDIWYSANRVTYNKVATVTPTTAVSSASSMNYRFAADLYNDNSIALVWATASNVRFRKITFSTWAIGAEQTVLTNPANGLIGHLDVSVSAVDTVLVGYIISYSTGTSRGTYRVIGQRSGLGTWEFLSAETHLSGENLKAHTLSISVCWGSTNISTNIRAYCVLIGFTNTNFDAGFRAYVSQTTEAATLSEANKNTLFTNIDSSRLAPSGQYTTAVRATNVVASGANSEFTLAFGNAYPDPDLFMARTSYILGNWESAKPTQMINGIRKPLTGVTTCAITMGANRTANFLINIKGPNPNAITYNYIGQIREEENVYKYIGSGSYNWNNAENTSQHVYMLQGGGGKYANLSTKHDMVFQVRSNDTSSSLHTHYAENTFSTSKTTPATGSVINSSTPPLSLHADLNKKYPQSRVKGRWEIDTTSNFSSGEVITWNSFSDKFTQVSNTHTDGVTQRMTDQPPEYWTVYGGSSLWVRSTLVDEFGNIGTTWNTAGPFTISHPPVAAAMSPSGGKVSAWVSGEARFEWKFTDPFAGDLPAAYQIIVEDNDTGAVVVDTGKVDSLTAQSAVVTIPLASKDKMLRWKVRLWDRFGDGQPGPYTEYQTFILADPPSIAVNFPTSGGTINTGLPSVTFTPTIAGSRRYVWWRAVFSQNGYPVFNTGNVPVNNTSGTQIVYVANKTVFKNNSGYSVKVTVADELGLVGQSNVIPFSVVFTPPAAPTGVVVDTDPFNSEDLGGYVEVTWSNAAQDPDFQMWAIYRRDDITDPLTGQVIQAGELKLLEYVYDQADSYSYRDYYAPSGYQVTYLVTQIVNRFNDMIESTNTVGTTVYPVSEGYWLIEFTDDTTTYSIMRLANVTVDDYTDEYEEAEYNVLGRGRHFDRGEYLGQTGSLTAQLRDGQNSSARMKKVKLETIKKENRNLYLRNPFGDILRVYVGNIGVSRIAGVGTSEFVDVTIPYSEVGASSDE